MKRGKIIILILVSIFIKSYGQKIDISNTKDLISISKSEGLVSAIDKLEGIPIYYIDRATTKVLLKQTMNHPDSYAIESFLLNLTLDEKLPELAEPLNHLIILKTKSASEISSIEYNKINKNELYPMTINFNKKTEDYLIQYYTAWLNLAKKNRGNYIIGKSDSLKYKNEPLNISIANMNYDLMNPYKICNYNCYMIMLALKQLGSSFGDNKKLFFHQKVGEALDINLTIFKHEKGNTFLKNKTPRTINLNKSYNTIRDIDFTNELNFKNKYLKDMDSDFGIYGFYNQKSGIIKICHDNKCEFYLVKLIDANKLQIYKTTMYEEHMID